VTLTLDEMIEQTGVRQTGFRLLVDDLLRRQWPTVVETGCARQPGNWQGDGLSTLLWSAVPNAVVHTFDIDREAVDNCREMVKDCPRTSVWLRDGITGLVWLEDLHASRLAAGISLLYLDSMDVDMANPHEAARHTLFEFIAARGLLRPGSLVAVDDNLRREDDGRVVGKGRYVADFMSRAGKTLIHDGYQMVWRW